MKGAPPSRRDLVSGNRLFGVEVVRIVMALAIVVWHYQHLALIATQTLPFIREQQPFYPALRWLYDYGAYRVPTFWSISGFIFYWLYRQSISAGTVSGRDFLVLRISRLIPLHWLTLLLVAALQYIYHLKNQSYFVYQNNDLQHFVRQVFLASDWGFQQGYSFNGPIWAISVEVLVLILFYALLRWLGGSWRVVFGVLSVTLAFKLSGISFPIVDCAMYFYAGGLAALALSWHERLSSPALTYRGTLLAGVVSLFVLKQAGLLSDPSLRPYWLLVYLPILLFLICRPVHVPPQLAKAVRTGSNATYAIYLIHFPIQLLLACVCSYWALQLPFYSRTFFLLFMFATVIVSLALHQLFERPMQDWLRSGHDRSSGTRKASGSTPSKG
ncbi:acyltransferase [Hydrogenophaga aromaticivorans]|uniref:acyltransferase family protein n=1 Tax=Hydrogenophaga aromaticivorans TaxID=2610898 RepID=UPI001B35E85A|nr:acyltransferase [Hydrogenophaga aromaticivorans]MBQ0920961.1 acyltransferase [Hydrogenophaga aromaticivorans]